MKVRLLQEFAWKPTLAGIHSNKTLHLQEVIRSGRRLQNEITAESAAAGTASRPEFYRKNLKWSEGLVSASKDIGRGAKLLVSML